MTTHSTTKPKPHHLFLLLVQLLISTRVKGKCDSGCNLALASYYIGEGKNFTYISTLFGKPTSEILKYNPSVKDANVIKSGTRINVPFSCDCLNSVFLGHTFSYQIRHGDTYKVVAQTDFSNLTTEDWVSRVNSYPSNVIPDNVNINVTINCSCGNRHVSKHYGLFLTYPLRLGDDLQGLAAESGVPAELLVRYNPASDFSSGIGLVFVPAKGN